MSLHTIALFIFWPMLVLALAATIYGAFFVKPRTTNGILVPLAFAGAAIIALIWLH